MKTRRHGAGKLIECPGGYEAYIPDPLPPQLEITQTLMRSLSDADRRIGQLAGEGRRLPNPHLLLRPFIRQEAVRSSRIEGTQATLGELLAADAGASVERSPSDLREVANYVVALEHGVNRLESLPLSLRMVRELHELLMRDVRGEQATPGLFRRTQNWIGAPGSTLQGASFVPPPVDHLDECLGAWEQFLHDRSFPPLVQAGLLHSQFEAIHPFLDGNGRVGRLLITVFFIEREVLPAPLLYLSAFFDATRQDYYDHLAGVTEDAAWAPWLTYFLRGIARVAEDALDRAERINALLEQWRKELAGEASTTPVALVDLLAENPFWSVGRIAERLEVAYTTAERAVKKLQARKILHQVGERKRDRLFCANALMDILDEAPTFED